MPVPFEIFQGLLPDPAQVGAAQIDQRVALQRIELQIDFKSALVLCQPRHEIRLARDAQAVGVDHDMADRAGANRVEDREKLRMQGRLAAGYLHQIGLAFAGHQRVQHFLDRCQRQETGAHRRGFRETDRAGQIAVIGDFDQSQAGMLLVIRAQAAIERAAEFSMALQRQRPVTRLDEFLAAPPIGGIGRYQRGLDAMLPAALLVPDLVAKDLDLGGHQRQAGFTQRLGLAPENIRTRSTCSRHVHV